LGAAKGHLPADLHDELDIFASHVRAVLTEQPAVNGLLREIAAVPTADGIDALDNLLSGEQRETELLAQQYRRYLLIFAAALVALLPSTPIPAHRVSSSQCASRISWRTLCA